MANAKIIESKAAKVAEVADKIKNAKSVIVFEPSEEMVGYIKHYLPYGAHQEN